MKWTHLPNLPKAVYLYLRYILTKLGDTRLLILVTTYQTIKGEFNQFPNSFYSFALKYLRSRYENASPSLCWVFCALLGYLCN